ncbi:hypothetical protein P170DRAFT_142353 [Aspergillus steynii IBT 23096]|uniref:Uncharacterized protein n=1 Tax=Aspergillus steynii IBT 23096 TaxID=1392250 RepID=A0A2I2GBW5_9EURO|nr:uncharacterized protein P170DRAFT_142353 [Aspergillus steynii IBT 23096]PLB50355.1 hypothetical protein P170DRAFT_142353 [Aspergillus steynii IBT 23096]
MASTSTTTTTTSHKHDLLVSANFATTTSIPSKPTIDYDHEIYLQLTAEAGRPAKTANQVYLEERARQKSTRALDPAISDPQGEPGAIDFECAEKQGERS